MKKLAQIQKESAAVCDGFRIIHLICGLYLNLWCMAVPWSATCDPFQKDMRNWLRDINTELLEPAGCYAKGFCFAGG